MERMLDIQQAPFTTGFQSPHGLGVNIVHSGPVAEDHEHGNGPDKQRSRP